MVSMISQVTFFLAVVSVAACVNYPTKVLLEEQAFRSAVHFATPDQLPATFVRVVDNASKLQHFGTPDMQSSSTVRSNCTLAV